MRFSSHLSSSTFSTGKLEAVRVNPFLRRRIASSRPSRWGIETMRGADIFCTSGRENGAQVHVIANHLEKRGTPLRARGTMELSGFPFVFSADGRATRCRLPG